MYRNKHKLSLEIPPVTDSAAGDLDAERFVPVQNIATIKQGELCLSNEPKNISFVQKKWKKTIIAEIEIYRLIASNTQSKNKAIIQPFNIEESSLLFPLMPSNLNLQYYFLFEQFKKKSPIASSWLMKQLFLLLETLHHLHTETFALKDRDPVLEFKGIIHGDIKSDNILIDELGNLVLADFDCAYPATEPARQFGSLHYVAPELFSNMDFARTRFLNIDKSDIWSLGITLYRLLNNKFPVFFNSFTSSKKNSAHHFFQEKIIDKDNYCTLWKDNISSFLDLKKWGENYSSSFMAKKAKESLGILQANKEKNEAQLTQSDILNHLSIAMLGSIKDRPNAEELLTLLQAWQQHFYPAKKNEYQQFINELLSHSFLHRETGDNKHFKPSPAQP